MKRLILLRHGKSPWSPTPIEDIDRPLAEQGVANTIKVAKEMSRLVFIPDLIVSSSALRALDTAKIAANLFNIPTNEVVTVDALYHASVQDLWSAIFALPKNVESAMIVGHNPGLTEFAYRAKMSQMPEIPTSGVVIGEFDCAEWFECINIKPHNCFAIWPAGLK